MKRVVCINAGTRPRDSTSASFQIGAFRGASLALILAAGTFLGGCSAGDDPTPNPTDTRVSTGDTGGTPGSAGLTGTGTGLGTGTNGPAETAAGPAANSQSPAVSVSGNGVNLKPVNPDAQSQ